MMATDSLSDARTYDRSDHLPLLCPAVRLSFGLSSSQQTAPFVSSSHPSTMSTVPRFGGGGVKCKTCADNVYASGEWQWQKHKQSQQQQQWAWICARPSRRRLSLSLSHTHTHAAVHVGLHIALLVMCAQSASTTTDRPTTPPASNVCSAGTHQQRARGQRSEAVTELACAANPHPRISVCLPVSLSFFLSVPSTLAEM